MTKILIAEDNQLFRKALKRILSEYEIVGEAQDGIATVQLLKRTNPDLLVLDLSLPKMNGLSVLKTIRPFYPELKIIVLTMHGTKDYFRECVNTGIDAFVLKDEGRKKLKEAVQQVISGSQYFSPSINRI
jgi:DNA-binding NarL/FixJ family response regulator